MSDKPEQFDTIRGALAKVPKLIIDLETLPEEGRTKGLKTAALDVYTNQINLVVLGAKNRVSVHKWSTAVVDFINECLANPNLHVGAHNATFDFLSLHYKNVGINIADAKCKLFDTLIKQKLLDPEAPAGLKEVVWERLGHRMTTFEEANDLNPAAAKLKEIKHYLEKTLPKQVLAEGRKINKWVKTAISVARKKVKEKLAGRRGVSEERAAMLARLFSQIEAVGEKKRTDLITKVEDFTREQEAEMKRLKVEADEALWTYAYGDGEWTYKLDNHLNSKIRAADLELWTRVEMDALKATLAMSVNGVLIDVPFLEKLATEIDPFVAQLQNEVFETAKTDDYSLGSPKQLGELLWDYMALPLPEGAVPRDKDGNVKLDRKTGRPFPEKPTGANVLERVDHPIGLQILSWRTADKLASTFIHKMLNILKETGDSYIHTILKSFAAVTGRMTSGNPMNLQQIPSRDKPDGFDPRIQKFGKRIRQAFIAAPGRKLVVSDCSQVELRLIAEVSQAEAMLDTFNATMESNGMVFYPGDIHATTMELLGVPRKIAKNANFLLLYGGGVDTFARTGRFIVDGTNGKRYDVDNAGRVRDKWLGAYNEIPAFWEMLAQRQNRARSDDAEDDFHNGYDEDYGFSNERQGSLKHFVRMVSGRRRFFRDRMAPGAIFNQIIQGSAADVLKFHIAMIDRHVVHDPEWEGRISWRLQVHDEVLLDADEEIAWEVAARVKVIMEHPWFEMSIPLLASTKVCDNWGQGGDGSVAEIGYMYAQRADGTGTLFGERNLDAWNRADKAGDFKKAGTRVSAVSCLPRDVKERHLAVLSRYEAPVFGRVDYAPRY